MLKKKNKSFLLAFLLLLICSQSKTMNLGDCDNSGQMNFANSTIYCNSLTQSGIITAANSDIIIKKDLIIIDQDFEFRICVSKICDDNADTIIHLPNEQYMNIFLPEKQSFLENITSTFLKTNPPIRGVHIENALEIRYPRGSNILRILDENLGEIEVSEKDLVIKPSTIRIKDKLACKLLHKKFNLSDNSQLIIAGIAIIF
jgi:hypothetical protein